MSAAIYMDVHVPACITRELRRRGVGVLTAQEDGAGRLPDEQLLVRAGELNHLLFTMDTDFLAEAVRCQRRARSFATVIYAHPLGISIGRCVEDLALAAGTATLSDCRGQIIYLPL